MVLNAYKAQAGRQPPALRSRVLTAPRHTCRRTHTCSTCRMPYSRCGHIRHSAMPNDYLKES